MSTYTTTSSTETCDATASGSEAAAIVVLTPGGPLTFCCHHFRQYAGVFLGRTYPAALVNHTETVAHEVYAEAAA